MANTYDLSGMSAVVTGGARGIGRAIAERLVASGAKVFVWDANVADLGAATSIRVDVTDPAQISQALAESLDKAWRIAVLINNAGTWAGCMRSKRMRRTIGGASSKST